jgi:hypothetical protein
MENYKTLEKEIEEDYRRWKDLPCLWIGRISIVKTAILPKAIYMFNAIPIKIPMLFISEIEKSTLKFIWKQKRLQIAKAIFNKKSKAGGITIPNFKLYYKTIAIKTAWYWPKTRHEDQFNRIEDTHINPHNYSYFIFDKDAKCTMEKRQPLQQVLLGKWLSVCKKLKLDPSPCTSINSKWVKDLNIRPKTLKLVQERSGNTLGILCIGKDFLNKTPPAQQLRARMDKWDYIKLKSFCTTKKWSLN